MPDRFGRARDPGQRRGMSYYIGNLEVAELCRDEIHFYNIDREEIRKDMVEIKWDAESAEKGGYEHFMLKEIHEQPKASAGYGRRLCKGRTDRSVRGGAYERDAGRPGESLYRCLRFGVPCRRMVAKYVMEELADVPVEVDLASEFRYRNPKLMKDSMVIVVSQSGETADSLAALRLAKEKGVPVLGIVNVVGSSIARESDFILYTYAGPEISVATTKAYSTQLIAVYLLAIQAAFAKGTDR